MLRTIALGMCLVSLLGSSVQAATITFGTADVDNLASVGTLYEAGFEYSATGAGWELQTLLANPGAAAASYFNGQGSFFGDSINIVRTGGGLFQAVSLDYAKFSNTASDQVSVIGYLGGVLQWSTPLTGPATSYTTLSMPNSLIDQLVLFVTLGTQNSAMAIDNIVLTIDGPAVPEPGSLALAGMAGLGMMVNAWRRRQTA